MQAARSRGRGLYVSTGGDDVLRLIEGVRILEIDDGHAIIAGEGLRRTEVRLRKGQPIGEPVSDDEVEARASASVNGLFLRGPLKPDAKVGDSDEIRGFMALEIVEDLDEEQIEL